MRSVYPCLATLGAALVHLPAAAQEVPQISLEHRMRLRCSAAFALVAKAQQDGDAAARAYPPLAARGREYFVRSAAEVMDGAGLDRDQISAVLAHEARDLSRGGTLEQVMPVCLRALDDSGL